MKSTIPFVIMAVCIGMYFVYIKPTIADIGEKRLKKAEYDNVLGRVQEIKQRRDTLSTKYNDISSENIEKLNRIIPSKFDPTKFIYNLNSISSKYGMIINNVKTDYTTPRAENPETQVGESSFKTVSAKISLNGRYDQFMSFMRDLEKSLELMDVVDLSIRAGSVKRGGEDLNLSYNLEIYTYSLQ
jgi:Tfp pilus assembly protein PilO